MIDSVLCLSFLTPIASHYNGGATPGGMASDIITIILDKILHNTSYSSCRTKKVSHKTTRSNFTRDALKGRGDYPPVEATDSISTSHCLVMASPALNSLLQVLHSTLSADPNTRIAAEIQLASLGTQLRMLESWSLCSRDGRVGAEDGRTEAFCWCLLCHGLLL